MSEGGFDALFERSSPWLEGVGPHAEMVLSTRIRLARNLNEVPFTHRARDEQLQGVLASVAAAARESRSFGDGVLLRMHECSPEERHVLVERHLVSHELGDGARPRGILVAEDARLSLMINEEDHLRLQALTPGFELAEAWGLADRADDDLDQALDYAWSDEIGYLTATDNFKVPFSETPTGPDTALTTPSLAASVLLLPAALVIWQRYSPP